eukprot:Selendium_serpulae@DN1241_c0_g1_i1.p1
MRKGTEEREMGCDEPTLEQVLNDFVKTVKPTTKLSVYQIEDTMNSLKSACEMATHRTNLRAKIIWFCEVYTEKWGFSGSDEQRTYLLMSKLTDYLYANKLMTLEGKKEVKRCLTRCRFPGEKICRMLNGLHDSGYWKSLEGVGSTDDDDDDDD